MARRTREERGRAAAAAAAALAEAHLDDVYRYALALVREPSIADDVAAETFERALRAWERYDPGRGTPRAWLLQLTRTAALDHLRAEERRRRREHLYVLMEPDEARPGGFGEGLSPELEAALGRLSAGEREVVLLRLLLDLDGRAAARVLGISETACSTRLSRALRRLEEEMRTHAVA